MASRSEWQPNYRDLSDDRTISFGAECYVCHAHYVSAPETMVAPLPAEGEPDPEVARAIEEQKVAIFGEFDRAFRSITIVCFRCGNPACPDCWDVDKQMCGACVAVRGLIRSPHAGEPAEGPLAEGFLRRAEPGEYSEVARPSWLKDLLRAQSDPAAAQLANLTAPPRPSAPDASPPNLALVDAATYSRVPAIERDKPVFEPVPTTKISAPTPLPGPTTPDRLNGPEGEATSGLVECPRCGTTNYDFVTQCSGCGLQLIQICPNCERLNPGHLKRCEQCGSPLMRPAGWSGVHQRIERLEPAEGRRRATAAPARITPAWQPAQAAWPAVDLDDTDAALRKRGSARVGRPAPQPTPLPAFAPLEASLATPTGVASAQPSASAELVTGRHPYETMGPALQPVLAYAGGEGPASRGVQVVQSVALVVERLFTVALLVTVFTAIGVIVAAESSQSANASLTAYLHYDVKAHVDALLALLHIHVQQ